MGVVAFVGAVVGSFLAFSFFVYALGSGTFVLFRSINTRNVKRIVIGALLTASTVAFVIQSFASAHGSLPLNMRLSSLLLKNESPFSAYAGISHVFCLVLGAIASCWLALDASPPFFQNWMLQSIFFFGSFSWFRLFASDFGFFGDISAVPAADAFVLATSHTFAFFMGALMSQDYVQRSTKGDDAALVRYYTLAATTVLVVPYAAEQVLLSSFPNMELPLNFVVIARAVVATLLFGVVSAPNHVRAASALALAIGAALLAYPASPETEADVGRTVIAVFDQGSSRVQSAFARYPVLWACASGIAIACSIVAAFLGQCDLAGASKLLPRTPNASQRRLSSYIAPYPNGWFKLIDSAKLKTGDLKYMECCGQDLVVFRGEDGVVGVLNAYCPHMGANLAAGGRVVGSCVECPFHRWQFDKDGACTKIPYEEKVPAGTNTRAWPSMEWCGMVLFYFDAERRPPPYNPPAMPEYTSPDFCFRGAYDYSVRMHIQEFVENSGDFQHFGPLHGKMQIPFTEIPIPFFSIFHRPKCEVGTGENAHLLYFSDMATVMFRGKLIPGSDGGAVLTFIGPGGINFFRFETPIGQIILFQSHTPLEPDLQRTEFRWIASKSMPRFLVWYIVGQWIAQWKNDIMVWENKRFATKPLLVKNDGPIGKSRRWYQQFYSESSAHVGTTLDW